MVLNFFFFKKGFISVGFQINLFTYKLNSHNKKLYT